jgi:hypothetical protein
VYVGAAATVGAAYDAAKESVRCTTPPLPLTASANLTVTLNGQQYAAVALAYAVVGNLDSDEGVWRFAPYNARHVEGCNLSNTNLTEVREIAPSCVRNGVQGMRVRPAVGPTDGSTAVLTLALPLPLSLALALALALALSLSLTLIRQHDGAVHRGQLCWRRRLPLPLLSRRRRRGQRRFLARGPRTAECCHRAAHISAPPQHGRWHAARAMAERRRTGRSRAPG